MKIFIIFVVILISSNYAEKCGNFKVSISQLPWVVSIFSNKSNIVMCQGTIISKKHILTAGHCLEHKNPTSLLVYSGLIFNRSMDGTESLFENQKLWQVQQITIHPDKKLTSTGKFIHGGFIASMSIHADLAIATLKQEIQLGDISTPICLPIDDSIINLKLQGNYSGWNLRKNEIELHNAIIDPIANAEIFEINENVEDVDFVSGTGFYSEVNSSWTIIGMKIMKNDDHQNGKATTKFINIHMFVNWIMNFMQNSSSTFNASSLSSTHEKSAATAIEEKVAAKSIDAASSTTENISSISTSSTDSTITGSTLLLTKSSPTTVKSTKTSNQLEKSLTTETSAAQNKETSTEKPIIDSTMSETSTTNTVTTEATKTLSTESLLKSSISAIIKLENSTNHESGSMSTASVTSSTPLMLINTIKNETESSTSINNFHNDSTTVTTTKKIETTTKSSFSSSDTENISATDIPMTIVSKLQSDFNQKQGRNLKDLVNNITDVSANASMISSGLPSVSFVNLTSTSPLTQNFTIDNQPTITNVNETLPLPQNSTDSDGKHALLSGINLSPAVIISGVFLGSFLLLIIVFGILGQAKPVIHDH